MCQITWIKIFDRVACDFVFSALQKFGYGDKFILTIKVAFTNIQSKIKVNCILSDPFTLMRGVPLWCILILSMLYTLLRLRHLSISLIGIKEMQIGNHEIKIVNFAHCTTIFLRDITCLNRIHRILILYI